MTTIRLHNTKTRRKEDFVPIDPANVRMYVCGPTVYDRAHLGNARPVVVFDVLFRLLRHVYGPDHVTYVRNITDVDDKINAEALRRKKAGAAGTLEELIHDRTEETIAWYHADMGALGALPPTFEPRATEYIEQMKAMIATLIDRGYAYTVRDPSNDPPAEFVLMDREKAAQEHALFAVETYGDYGKLSGRSVEDMIAGARVEVAPYIRNPADFVLWKPSDASLPGWDSPWGRGRPGWHIECSAMSLALLGEQFDIHGGGIDLQFPHHENEIAQSCCALATPDDPLGRNKFARFWLHNEMLQVEGKKMSKSLGNFFTVRDLLDRGIPGEVIRFVLLGTHYSKPMDWTAEKVRQARQTLVDWYSKTDGVEPDYSLIGYVERALSNDLNTHAALEELRTWSNSSSDHSAGSLKAGMSLLGFPPAEAVDWFRKSQSRYPGISYSGSVEPKIDTLFLLLTRLTELRTEKNYDAADALRKGIEAAGVKVIVFAGTTFGEVLDDFDPAKLEALQ
ncbi:MAG: cysteine--tRNA ligase [Rhodobacter sp.]|nr:cysteine--tRNA ligase [Rhodobacter sp.]